MLFISNTFIFIFLPVAFLLYFYPYRSKRLPIHKVSLLAMCMVFYGYYYVYYLPILITSIIINFFIGNYLSKGNASKAVLTVGIILNILVIFYFKYLGFFSQNISAIINIENFATNLLLPLGISFFTFQQVAFLIDCYQGKIQRNDFLTYSIFVSFFPQLIAGPIVLHQELSPQLLKQNHAHINKEHIIKGLSLFAIGLFKKVAIADKLAILVKSGYASSSSLTLFESWATSLSYTLQLYFDFSGYTDMALGAALLFNIKLPVNFNSPYKSGNIQEFWRRWHITLGRFFRDYLYIPLGGNKKGLSRTTFNIMITFALCGLWHGAGWTFVLWGCLHGIALAILVIWQKINYRMSLFLGWFITINFINLSWVFFRANSIKEAVDIIKGMFGANGITFPAQLHTWLIQLQHHLPVLQSLTIKQSLNSSFGLKAYTFIFLLFIPVLCFPNSQQLIAKLFSARSSNFSYVPAAAFGFLMFLGILFANISTYSEFIYFNF